MIRLKQVTSTLVQAYAYDQATQVLAIQFMRKPEVVHFKDVPPGVGLAFDAAESKGKAYHALLKGKFQTELMPAEA